MRHGEPTGIAGKTIATRPELGRRRNRSGAGKGGSGARSSAMSRDPGHAVRGGRSSSRRGFECASAVGAYALESVGTVAAEGALKRADVSAGMLGAGAPAFFAAVFGRGHQPQQLAVALFALGRLEQRLARLGILFLGGE